MPAPPPPGPPTRNTVFGRDDFEFDANTPLSEGFTLLPFPRTTSRVTAWGCPPGMVDNQGRPVVDCDSSGHFTFGNNQSSGQSRRTMNRLWRRDVGDDDIPFPEEEAGGGLGGGIPRMRVLPGRPRIGFGAIVWAQILGEVLIPPIVEWVIPVPPPLPDPPSQLSGVIVNGVNLPQRILVTIDDKDQHGRLLDLTQLQFYITYTGATGFWSGSGTLNDIASQATVTINNFNGASCSISMQKYFQSSSTSVGAGWGGAAVTSTANTPYYGYTTGLTYDMTALGQLGNRIDFIFTGQ